ADQKVVWPKLQLVWFAMLRCLRPFLAPPGPTPTTPWFLLNSTRSLPALSGFSSNPIPPSAGHLFGPRGSSGAFRPFASSSTDSTQRPQNLQGLRRINRGGLTTSAVA